MSSWIWSGKAGLLLGLVVFVVLLAPMVAWHFWRYGAGNAKRLLGGAAACLYTSALVTYTLFPLPPRTAEYCAAHPVKDPASWLPGAFIGRIAERTQGLGLWQVLTSFHVLQVVFNVVLFVPWGILARRWRGLPLWAAVVTGFLGSALIEFTQYTALFGFFPCRYRFTDPDDLLMNTAGALLGALLAPAVLWWMPRSQLLEATRLDPRPVTLWRRWSGMLVDAALWLFVLLVVLGLWWLGCHALGVNPVPTIAVRLASGLIATVVVFVWPAWEGTGASAGQAAAWLAPRWRDGQGSGAGVAAGSAWPGRRWCPRW